ncbi:unnamed protein product [Caenorhabditis brenneri]
MADLTPEQNDFLSYIVHRSRRADVLNMRRVYRRYRTASNTNLTVDQLKTIFNLLVERIDDLQLLPRTKAKLLYSIQNEQIFDELFGEQFQFNADSLNDVTPPQRDSANKNRTGSEYTEDEINDWLMYVVESSRTARKPLNMYDIFKNYQKDSGILRTLDTLEQRFRLIIAPQLENANLLLMTRAKACYATKTSVSAEFLRELSLASIFVESSINITKFKPRGYLKRSEGRGRISKTDWDPVYENAMMDYLEDEASPGELKLAAIWRDFGNEYSIRHGDRTFHPIPITIDTHFLKKMKPEICSLVDRYDLSTLAKMCLMASISIDEDFLQRLQQHAAENDINFEFALYIKTLPVIQNRVQPYNMGAAAGGNLLEGLNTWTEVEDNDLLGYIASRAWNGERLDMNNIFEAYQASSGSRRTVEELEDRFDNHLRARIESSQYLHLTRLKILYATNTPISPEFRQTLTRLGVNTVVNGIQLVPAAPQNIADALNNLHLDNQND